jgi:hypothetical protein
MGARQCNNLRCTGSGMAFGIARILQPTRPVGFFSSACGRALVRIYGPGKCLSFGEFVESEHGDCGLRVGTSTGSPSECIARIATGASSGTLPNRSFGHMRSDARHTTLWSSSVASSLVPDLQSENPGCPPCVTPETPGRYGVGSTACSRPVSNT